MNRYTTWIIYFLIVFFLIFFILPYLLPIFLVIGLIVLIRSFFRPSKKVQFYEEPPQERKEPKNGAIDVEFTERDDNGDSL